MISESTVKSHYEDSDENRLSIEEYLQIKEDLLKNAIQDSDGDYYFSNDMLDDEYKYKKFSRRWSLINRKVQTISDPISVEIVKTVYNTNNPFINNLLKQSIKEEDNGNMLCVYDRPSARKDILEKYMKSIGVEFVGDKSNYNPRTEWSNSTHSVIYYAKAFGGYVLSGDDGWKSTNTISGTLDDCLRWYNSDKERIESIVHRKFMNVFGSIDETTFNFTELSSSLKSAQRSMLKVDPKVKSIHDYNNARKSLQGAITMIENKMEVN